MKTPFVFFNIFIILIGFMISCNNNAEKNILSIDTFLVKETLSIHYDGINPLFEQNKNGFVFYTLYPDNNKIISYNIKNTTTDTILFPNYYINSFHFTNKDSLWIFCDILYPTQKNGQLILTNHQQKIINQYDLFEPLQHKYGIIQTVFFDTDTAFNFNGKLFFTLINKNDLDTSIINNNNMTNYPIVGYFNTKNRKFYINKSITYPYLDGKRRIYYPSNYKFIFFTRYRDFLIVSFSYTNYIYLWNLKNNKTYLKKLHSNIIDTIKPCTSPCQKIDTMPKFWDLLYSKENKMFIRYSVLSDKYSNKLHYIFYDTNFNYLGEDVFEKPYMVNPHYFQYYNLVEFNNNNLILYKAKLVFKLKPFSHLQKKLEQYKTIKEKQEQETCQIIGKKKHEKVSNNHILNYFRKFHHITDTSFALIVLHKYGCYSCNEYIKQTLSINKKSLFSSSKNFYLLLTEENETIQKIKSKYSILLSGISQNKILFDTTYLYNKIHPFSSYNPRLILVRNNKIIYDTISLPDKLESIIFKLLEYYQLETQK
ncbi:MAG: DUF4221 domain-containing protein [Bacteroidales bacterium]|nr:DUF4221 domain-containing protein [Bacteroidales bacterium]